MSLTGIDWINIVLVIYGMIALYDMCQGTPGLATLVWPFQLVTSILNWVKQADPALTTQVNTIETDLAALEQTVETELTNLKSTVEASVSSALTQALGSLLINGVPITPAPTPPPTPAPAPVPTPAPTN
jgi:hypothetical protein